MIAHHAEMALQPGVVVAPARDLAGVQAPDGTLLAPERLGLGLVQVCSPGGDVCVHWLDADLDLWVAGEELRVLGANRHVVSLWRRDQRGQRSLVGRRLAALQHDWTIELLPRRVIRVVQDTGLCWTFTFNTLTHEVDPPWTEASSDDAAEAIVAADLAMEQVLPERQVVRALSFTLYAILHPSRLKSA
jgi:hypothetical protein